MAYIIVCLWLFSVKEGQAPITVCPSKLVYQIPCPGCGVTRATLFMLKGHIVDALLMNPNCLFAIVFLYTYPILLFLSIITGKPFVMNSYRMMDKMLRNKICLYTLLVCELIIWVHNIITGI
ncbi:MAG: DUF2752 domain-containing protein [Paraprevotella sp.]|nr:DUF2752 domain-containing protein [Paraprevotella sp.]